MIFRESEMVCREIQGRSFGPARLSILEGQPENETIGSATAALFVSDVCFVRFHDCLRGRRRNQRLCTPNVRPSHRQPFGSAVFGRKSLSGTGHGSIRPRYFLRQEHGLVSRLADVLRFPHLSTDQHSGRRYASLDHLSHALPSSVHGRSGCHHSGPNLHNRTTSLPAFSNAYRDPPQSFFKLSREPGDRDDRYNYGWHACLLH